HPDPDRGGRHVPAAGETVRRARRATGAARPGDAQPVRQVAIRRDALPPAGLRPRRRGQRGWVAGTGAAGARVTSSTSDRMKPHPMKKSACAMWSKAELTSIASSAYESAAPLAARRPALFKIVLARMSATATPRLATQTSR